MWCSPLETADDGLSGSGRRGVRTAAAVRPALEPAVAFGQARLQREAAQSTMGLGSGNEEVKR